MEKRQRGTNFTFSERQDLLKLANKYKNIIENKKTDAVTWKQKEKVWLQIEQEFNTTTDGAARTAKQLKSKYELIKKDIKKKYSDEKKYLKKTGGGGHKQFPNPETEEEQELMQSIQITVEGLLNNFDCDALQSEAAPTEESIIMDWSGPSSSLLRTPRHPALEIQECDTLINESLGQFQDDVTVEVTDVAERVNTDTQPKKPKLSSKKTVLGTMKKKNCKSSASAKFEKLAETKLGLIRLEMEVVEATLNHNKKKFEMEIELMDLQKKKEELQIEILEINKVKEQLQLQLIQKQM